MNDPLPAAAPAAAGAAAVSKALKSCSDIPFRTVTKFFEKCLSMKTSAGKGDIIRIFRETHVNREADDIFQLYRLICPDKDSHRANFFLQETFLAKRMGQALNLDESSPDMQAVLKWREGLGGKGQGKSIKGFQGNFKSILYEHLLVKHCVPESRAKEFEAELTVGKVNEILDEMSVKDGETRSSAQTRCLTWLVTHSTAIQLKWIIAVLLRDVRLGKGSDVIMRDFHPDAVDMYNSIMDLEQVCLELRDPNKRLLGGKHGIKLGMPSMPQLAQSSVSPEDALKKMAGKAFVCEVKFDGERVQVHKRGGIIKYFSRRGFDHGTKSNFSLLDRQLLSSIQSEEAAVDGELVVWNKARRLFEPFGAQRAVVNAIMQNKGPEERLDASAYGNAHHKGKNDLMTAHPTYTPPLLKDLVLCLVVFDVLIRDGVNLCSIPLSERHKHLEGVLGRKGEEGEEGYGSLPTGHESSGVTCMVVTLLPDQPFLANMIKASGEGEGEAGRGEEDQGLTQGLGLTRGLGVETEGTGFPATQPSRVVEPPICFSRSGSTLRDIQEMYKSACSEHQAEGLMVKSLASEWKVKDRSKGSWLKLKPDYADGCEVDCLVIGGYFGKGRNGGLLSEFLLGLAVQPSDARMAPSVFESFAKVGTGMNDAERDEMRRKLDGNLKISDPRAGHEPDCYRVTGRKTDRPDAWIVDPVRSIVLTVKADARCIQSKEFHSRLSLRFPRVERIRWDLGINDVKSVADLEGEIRVRSGKLAGDYEAYSDQEGVEGEEEEEADRTNSFPGGLPLDPQGGSSYGGGSYGGSSYGGASSQGGGRRGGIRSSKAKKGEAPPGSLVPDHLRLHLSCQPPATSGQDNVTAGAALDLLKGQYVSFIGPPPPGMNLSQIQDLVKRCGGNYSMNLVRERSLSCRPYQLVREGARATSFLLANDTCRETEAHRKILGSLDCFSHQWLTDGLAQGALRIPPKPSDYILMSIKTRLGLPEHHDMHGNPHGPRLEPGDLRAIMDRHFDRSTYERVCQKRSPRFLMEITGEGRGGAEEEEEEEVEEQMDEYVWRRSLRDYINKEMRAIGIEPVSHGPFNGMSLFTLTPSSSPLASSDVVPEASSLNPQRPKPSEASSDVVLEVGGSGGLLMGCLETGELARRWEAEAEGFDQRSRSIAIRSQGGDVMDRLDVIRVTHLVLPVSMIQLGEAEILARLFYACRVSVLAGGKRRRGATSSSSSDRRARRMMARLKTRLRDGGTTLVSSTWLMDRLDRLQDGPQHTAPPPPPLQLRFDPLDLWTPFLPAIEDEASSDYEEINPDEEEEEEMRVKRRKKDGKAPTKKSMSLKSTKEKGKKRAKAAATPKTSKKKSNRRKRRRDEEEFDEAVEEEEEGQAGEGEEEDGEEWGDKEEAFVEEVGEGRLGGKGSVQALAIGRGDKIKAEEEDLMDERQLQGAAELPLTRPPQSRSLALLDMLNDMTRRQ